MLFLLFGCTTGKKYIPLAGKYSVEKGRYSEAVAISYIEMGMGSFEISPDKDGNGRIYLFAPTTVLHPEIVAKGAEKLDRVQEDEKISGEEIDRYYKRKYKRKVSFHKKILDYLRKCPKPEDCQ